MIHHWLRTYRKKYPDQEWFEAWLLRGDAPPKHITVPSVDEVRRCAKAWDYIALARAAGMSRTGTYELWFRRGTIPAGTDRVAWLKWLYSSKGYWRAPTFVVVPKLQAYRRKGAAKAIRKAARLNERTVAGWRRDPKTWALLAEVIQAARSGGKPKSEGFRNLGPAAQEAMRRYAVATTRTARCKAVSLSPVDFDRLRREAEARGVGRELEDYLDYRDRYEDVRLRRKLGIIDGGLFIPSEELCNFHEQATREWTRQNVAPLEQLPGFDAWFATWVMPLDPRGKRPPAVLDVPTRPTSTRQSSNRTVAPPIVETREEARPTVKQRGRPPSKETAEVYAFCFEELRVNGKKASVVLRLAIERFGRARAPKEVSKVFDCARRHEERLRKVGTARY
jgi:hypothetical protein